MIIYRTSGPWGSGVGANLTAAQVDGNFYDVSSRVQQLELHPPQPIQISSFSSTGSQLYIQMSDGTVQGPITMPVVRWFWRGAWAPNTSYSADHTFSGPDGGFYLVLRAHISATNFSPNANDGQGNAYYGLILATATSMIPEGGDAGSILTKNTGNSYDLIWSPPGIPVGGQEGAVLQKNSGQNQDASWNFLTLEGLDNVVLRFPFNDGDYLRWDADAVQWTNAPRPMLNVLQGSSWAPTIGDEGSFMVLFNQAVNTTITIPSAANVNFPIGSELHIHQDGTGTVTIVGDTGVTIRRHAAYANRLLGQYSTATVKKTDTNVWRLFGLLAGA